VVVGEAVVVAGEAEVGLVIQKEVQEVEASANLPQHKVAASELTVNSNILQVLTTLGRLRTDHNNNQAWVSKHQWVLLKWGKMDSNSLMTKVARGRASTEPIAAIMHRDGAILTTRRINSSSQDNSNSSSNNSNNSNRPSNSQGSSSHQPHRARPNSQAPATTLLVASAEWSSANLTTSSARKTSPLNTIPTLSN